MVKHDNIPQQHYYGLPGSARGHEDQQQTNPNAHPSYQQQHPQNGSTFFPPQDASKSGMMNSHLQYTTTTNGHQYNTGNKYGQSNKEMRGAIDYSAQDYNPYSAPTGENFFSYTPSTGSFFPGPQMSYLGQ